MAAINEFQSFDTDFNLMLMLMLILMVCSDTYYFLCDLTPSWSSSLLANCINESIARAAFNVALITSQNRFNQSEWKLIKLCLWRFWYFSLQISRRSVSRESMKTGSLACLIGKIKLEVCVLFFSLSHLCCCRSKRTFVCLSVDRQASQQAK